MASSAAFFDLDKTLIDIDAGVRFGTHLLELARIERDQATGPARRALTRRYRLFKAEIYAKAVLFFPLYKTRLMKRSTLVRESYVFFRGQEVERLLDALDTFFDEELNGRVYPEVERVLAWHRDQGHETVLLTTGLQLIADRYALALGIDRAIGVRLEESDGRLTGRVAGGPLWGRDKAEIARVVAEEEEWDLSQCYAYTDHHSDEELLELVGHPRPVHPDRRLARLARAKGWPVLDFADPERAFYEGG